jgi:hypothetical protein
VSKLCAPFPGRVFGLGLVTISALACSGAVFKSEPQEPVEPEPTDPVVVSTRAGNTGRTTPGGAGTTTTTGGTPSEARGGASQVVPPQQGGMAPVAPPQGGNYPGGNGGDGAGGAGGAGGSLGGNGGAAGAVTTAGAGGSVLPPDQGSAGNPNIPEPPRCASPLAENWTAAIGANGSNWQVAFGDPSIDVVNHRLVVTHDDVAARTSAYEGGYYVTAEVVLEGGTVLTPYPYANELRWPSLRRNSTGTGVELGATKYGSSESWSSNDWAGFSGTTISGTKAVLLTTYVKATANALAVKVSYGGQTYRSGWVSGFTWPQTNLGIMRFIGENNSRVYQGDAVYVGALSGCQKLTDAAVDALFQN